jgi:hypothetical protein
MGWGVSVDRGVLVQEINIDTNRAIAGDRVGVFMAGLLFY